MARVLFHIDLNAFFASAEELRHPEYKGKPLAVGSLSGRGVLSTCNYAAREKGIHSAMPTRQAQQLCPQLIVVPGDMDYYRTLSNKFFALLRQWSGALEVLSVDECFLDVTQTIKAYSRPLDLAVQIQMAVLKELGLKCSIGVAPTRFLAKMASDMHKPLGITVLRKSEIETKLFPLDISACMGIGKKTVPLLREKGIETIGDLALKENEAKARAVLGNSYDDLLKRITGRSSDQLTFSTTRKSVSHSRTFSHDLYELDEILEQCRTLCMELCRSMEKAKRMGSQISVILRDGNFNNSVHSARLSSMTRSYAMIYEAASRLCIEYFQPDTGYRHLGIAVGSLKDEEQIVLQPKLFDEQTLKTMNMSASIVDQLNSRQEIQELQSESNAPLLMTAGQLLAKKQLNMKKETHLKGAIHEEMEQDDFLH